MAPDDQDDERDRIDALLAEIDEVRDNPEVADRLRELGDRQRASLIARALRELGQDHGDVDVYANDGGIDQKRLAEKVVELIEEG